MRFVAALHYPDQSPTSLGNSTKARSLPQPPQPHTPSSLRLHPPLRPADRDVESCSVHSVSVKRSTLLTGHHHGCRPHVKSSHALTHTCTFTQFQPPRWSCGKAYASRAGDPRIASRVSAVEVIPVTKTLAIVATLPWCLALSDQRSNCLSGCLRTVIG